MKKSKDVTAVGKAKLLKRKPQDVQTTSPETKKRKKEPNNDVLPSSPNKAQLVDKTKKRLVQKKKKIAAKKPVQKSDGSKSQEEAAFIVNKTKQAHDVSQSSSLKKKKKKLNSISPQITLKKKKKLSQQTISQEESSKVENHEGATQDSNHELKQQKNRKKLVKGAPNSVEDIGTEKITIIKKKKQSLKEKQTTDNEASVTDASDSTQCKKKKKKKHLKGTLQSSTSANLSPTKSLQKKTKNKLHKKTENVVLVNRGPSTKIQLNEEDEQSSANLNSPELSKKKMKFIRFIKQKEDKAEEEETEMEESKALQTPLLKGKALRKHISSLQDTIIKLEKLNDDQAMLLLKVTSQGKIKKVQERIKKIKTKVKQLKSELAVYEPQLKSPLIEVVNNKVFKQLPRDPPPKKKKTVDLKEFLQNQMKASRFRWLNENLYNSSSEEAQGFFKNDPESFKAYHEGYSEQVAKWPVNPLDVIIDELKSLPRGSVVADLGCGEAKLAAALPNLRVHSLDFIAVKPEVIACDMAHCPLLRSSVDVAVFCLSLMGTNISDFLLEANRILKTGGTMEIAEVESRFENIDDFVKKVQQYGFQLQKKNLMDMFFFLTFTKKQDVVKTKKLPEFELKPCVYKKR